MDLSNVDVRDFLSALGMRNMSPPPPGEIYSEDEIQFSCPFPGHAFGDQTPSAYMNVESTAFFCHGCKSKGNAIHFLSKLEGISPLLAARYIRERYGTGFLEADSFLTEVDNLLDQSTSQSRQVILDNFVDSHKSIQNLPDNALDYLHNRGFCDEAISAWQIGYDNISDRIAIPVWNENGILIGFNGRAYRSDHKPKYLVLGDTPKRSKGYGFPTYEKSRVVFGLDKFIPNAATYNHHLIITEGELDVISLWQNNIKNSVSCGSNFSSCHRQLIINSADSVTCFLDDDPAGNSATEKIARELMPYMQVRVVGPHDGDPASLTAEECSTLISKAQALDYLG